MNSIRTLVQDISAFLRIKRSSALSASHLRLLRDCEYFDMDYYRQSSGLAKASPEVLVEHYVRIGSAQGLNPGKLFDTRWYRQFNPDIDQAGINPLLHFVKFGEAEGRSPCPETHNPDDFSSPVVCGQKIWGGFSNHALPKLEELASGERRIYRIQSLWHLADWYYVHGNPALALKKLRLLVADLGESHGLTKKLAVSHCKCLLAMGEVGQYAEFWGREDVQTVAGAGLPYLQANTELLYHRDETAWLKKVNSIFVDSGLCSIRKLDADKPLALGNLAPAFTEKQQAEETPKVSVIVPAYNAAGSIHIALNSLVNQTWSNLEIVVVDDASTDDTGRVVQEFCQRIPYIKYLRNAENMGAYPTRNRGYQQTAGEFITLHDSDDWSHPQKIEKQVEALLQDDSVVASLTSCARINEHMGFIGPWMLCEDFVEKNHSSTMIRRSVIEKIGAWDEVNVAADAEFLRRLEKVCGSDALKIIKPEVPFSFAVVASTSLTQSAATHVKTVYYGLRRLYHEAAAWWHATETDDLYLDPVERKFPYPLGNRRGAPGQFDLVLAGDFSTRNEQLSGLIEEVQELAESNRLTLFHWPDYRRISDEKIAPQVFELCMDLDLSFTHAGHKLSAERFSVFDSGLAIWVPDELPRIQGLQEIYIVGPADHIDEVDKVALKEKLSAQAVD